MAKPIRKTPSLRGDFAEKFLENMIKIKNRRINHKEKLFVDLISD